MSTLNDEILRATGGPTVNDGLRAFFLANGATAGTLNDLERQYLKVVFPAGAAAASNNDLWMGYLATLGHTGALNDRLLQFWLTQ